MSGATDRHMKNTQKMAAYTTKNYLKWHAGILRDVGQVSVPRGRHAPHRFATLAHCLSPPSQRTPGLPPARLLPGSTTPSHRQLVARRAPRSLGDRSGSRRPPTVEPPRGRWRPPRGPSQRRGSRTPPPAEWPPMRGRPPSGQRPRAGRGKRLQLGSSGGDTPIRCPGEETEGDHAHLGAALPPVVATAAGRSGRAERWAAAAEVVAAWAGPSQCHGEGLRKGGKTAKWRGGHWAEEGCGGRWGEGEKEGGAGRTGGGRRQ